MRKERKRQGAKEGAWRSRRGRQAWVVDAFKAFGRHCARNQIRVLIIDSFVMTTLFYPALALFLQRRFPPLRSPAGDAAAGQPEHPLSLLSTPILDSFFPLPPPLLPLAQDRWFFENEDAVDTWQADRADSLLQQSAAPGSELSQHAVVFGATVALTHVGAILDADASANYAATLDKARLSVLQGAQDLSTEIGGSWTCLADPEKPDQCWTETSMAQANDDPGVFDSLTFYFIRRDDRVGEDQLEHALEAFHRDWTGWLRNLAAESNAEVFANMHRQGQRSRKTVGSVWSVHPRPATSETDSAEAVAPTSSGVPRGIILLFSALLGWLLYLLARATNVHNRFGLAFTGIVELTCSTVMSYSVLTLLQAAGLGWRPAEAALAGPGVPWYILPFVILVVGVENMSALTRGVHSIPVSESVPDRIGLGLAKVGPKLFMTSITDIAVLAVVGLVVQLRPVREFCTFACVLIFVDWWMLHTFYLTVLSIDCQRLELADVLNQNSKRSLQGNAVAAAATPKRPTNAAQNQASPAERLEMTAKSSLQRLWLNIKRARRARIGSLMLFLILLTILFYINESHRLRTTSLPGLYGYRGDQGYQQNESVLPLPTANASLETLPHPWGMVNPLSKPRVALVSMLPTTLVFATPGHLISPQNFRILAAKTVRSWLPRLTPLFHLVKVVLLPQWITAFLLYLLLLWLLKDTQLLDAQRNRPSIADKRNKSQHRTTRGRSSRLSGIASGMRTHTSAAVSTLDVTEIDCIDGLLLVRSSSAEIQAVSIMSDGIRPAHRLDGFVPKHCSGSPNEIYWAAVDASGKILLYRRAEQSLVPRELVNSAQSSVSAVVVRLVDLTGQQDPFLTEGSRAETRQAPEVLTAHADGSVWMHDLTGAEKLLLSPPEAVCTIFGRGNGVQYVATLDQRGGVSIYELSDAKAELLVSLNIPPSNSVVTCFSVLGLDSKPSKLILTGHEDGSVSVWLASNGALLASERADDRSESCTIIDEIQASSPVSSGAPCPRCRRPAANAWTLLWASQNQLFASSLHVVTTDDTCRCHLVRSPRSALLGGENSLSDGFAFVGRSPRKPSNAGAVKGSLHPPRITRPLSPGSEQAVHSDDLPKGSDVTTIGGDFAPQASLGFVQTYAVDRGGWAVLHGGSIAAVLDREPASARTHHGRRWQMTLLDLARDTEGTGFSEVISLAFADDQKKAGDITERTKGQAREPVDQARVRRLSALRGSGPRDRPAMTPTYQPISFARLASVTSFGEDRIAIGMGNRIGVITLPRPAPKVEYASSVSRRWSAAVPPPQWPLGQADLLLPSAPPAKQKAD